MNELFALFDVDNRITVYHTALYLALFRLWNANHFVSPLRINRAIIMKMSKISSTKTYSKTIEELSQWGYVEYSPTNTKLHPSYVHVFTTRLLGKRVMPHLYKHINNKHIDIGQKEIFAFEEENESIPTEIPKEEIRTKENAASSTQNNPPMEHVKIYFEVRGSNETEAEKFFNHYEALGWVNSSGTTIRDWKASARNWIINIPKFNQKPTIQSSTPLKGRNSKFKPQNNQNEPLKPGAIHLNTNKKYDTPL
ncbi:MAG: hypothetical protein ACWA6U_11875 [Breznakibacter sp.]